MTPRPRLAPSPLDRLRRVIALVAVLAPAPAVAQSNAGWRAHSESAERARQAGDWASYARLIDSVYAGLGNHPNLLWARARAAARLGQTERAVEALRVYAASGLSRDVAADSAFVPLLSNPEVRRLKERIDANGAMPARARVHYTIADSGFVPESVVHDSTTDRLFVSSIRHGVVRSLAPDGSTRTVARAADARLGAMFGLALDAPRRVLWAGAQQIPLFDGYATADSGRTAVAAFDLGSGRVLRRLAAPDDSAGHSFGDLAVLADGTLLVSDAVSGAIFTAAPGDSTLRALVPRGPLASPQGIAPVPGGGAFHVADYALGIMRVDLATGRAERVPHPDSIVVSGIDGLIRVGSALVGVQNGTFPKRVIRLDLDAAGDRIVGSRVLESNPEFLGEATHLVHRNGTIYFMARTGYDDFTEDGTLKPGVALRRPIIGAVELR